MIGNAADQVNNNQGFNNFDMGDMLIDGAIGGVSGTLGGRGMGKSANIKTLNNNLTKRVFSESTNVAKNGIKYYISQTKYMYKENLLKPLVKSGITSLIGTGTKAIHLRGR